MRSVGRILVAVLLLAGGVAAAQDGKGWLGADVLDVTKAEADKLGWDSPHGAKLGVVASGSPADKAGLKAGDVITAVERTLLDTSAEVEAAITAKPPGAVVRLQVLSAARERSVTVTLAERPKIQATQDQALPLLMLDTDGHTALITDLAFTPDGRQLVSAGVDKVIRIWDWQTGKTVRTIRGQVGLGNEGRILAMALSPDGRWLAAGGLLPGTRAEIAAIRLYDFNKGKLLALLKGHTDVVKGLAFSLDSKRLISGGASDKTAIVWDVESHQLVQRLQGHKDQVYAVAFTADGARAVTGGYDNTPKLWSVKDGKELGTLTGHKDKVLSLAVSPRDGTLATGSTDGEIRLWDGNTGRYLRSLANQGSVGTLRFSPDSKELLSTCRGTPCVWDVASGGRLREPRHHDGDPVLVSAISPDGDFVATSGGNDAVVHVWDLKTGETKRVLSGTGALTWAVGFSADGQRIAWGTTLNYSTINDRGPLEYQLRLPAATQALGQPERVTQAMAKDFLRARATHGPYAIFHRKGGAYGSDAMLDLKKDGQTILTIERGAADGYLHRAYSFTPDGQTIISGGNNGHLIAYDLKGQRIGNFFGHESNVVALTPSPDGRLLVSGSDDQTVRLWNLKTRELIVTLFHGTDGNWVMWTPQGYYTGSPGADKIVGWQINKGAENAAEYVGAEQLRQHLNRPDIVTKAIVLASAEAAVREAPGTTFRLADLLARPVPRFKIVAPTGDALQHGGRAAIRITIEATPDPIKAIRVQVNGRQVEEQTPDIGSGGFGAGERILDVPLAKGRNEVRITLTNAIGEKAETLTLNHEGEGALDRRGTLYILAIGVDRYATLGKTCGENNKESCDLRFSGADASALVAAAEQRLRPVHTKVVKRVLVNGAVAKDAPTASNILDAMDMLKEAKETDTVLLFIAGHGDNDGASYRFLATNAERLGGAYRATTVVPWQILQEAVETAKGRRILFIDTCHSGNAYNQQLGNAAYHANIIAYTSTRFDQEALEDPKLGHGLFTYAVVEGLEGKGGLASHRQISTKDLAAYVIKRVEELAKAQRQEQEPQYFKGRDAEDYVLARW
jgi:WD40 repeat protein